MRICAVVGVLVACGGSREPVPTATEVATPKPPPPAPAPTGTQAERPPPTARALPGYPPANEPKEAIACALAGAWELHQPRELRLHPDGPSFATMHSVSRAQLVLTRYTTFVELTARTARVWGYIPRTELTVHPAGPYLFDYVVPGPRVDMRIDAVRPTGITVVPRLPSWATARAPVGGERGCDDLTLTVIDFLPRSAIPDDEQWQAMLPAQTRIPVARTPGGKPVVELKFPKDDSPLVDVMERDGAFARVVVNPPTLNPDDGSLIVGWVRADLLLDHTHGFGGSWGSGGSDAAARGRPRAQREVTCAHEVPLIVELAGAQHLVGAALANVELGVIGDLATDDVVEIELPDGSIQLAPKAKLLAKSSALADCH